MNIGRSKSEIRNRRRGFTLLEVVLAVGIILLLVAAMFEFYDYALASRDRAEAMTRETQLARVVLTQIGEDLSSISALTGIVRQRMAVQGFTVQGASTGTTAEGGMAGTEDSVSFQSARFIPAYRFAEVATKDGGPVSRKPMYDVQEVRWHWNHDPDTGASGGLYRSTRPAVVEALEEDLSAEEEPDAAGESPAGGEAAAGEMPAADEGDQLPVDNPGGETPSADPLLKEELVSEEVQWIYLRYYDGASWAAQYQNGSSGSSPLAVEITIGFSPLLTQDQIDSGRTIKERFVELFGDGSSEPLPARSYQLVVYLPSGEMNAAGSPTSQPAGK